MSFKPEVQAANNGDKWFDNAIRFETEKESELYVLDLFCRWSGATATRTVPSDDPANYRWADGQLVEIKQLEEVQ